MKKIIKNIGCLTLAVSMLMSNIQLVYAYTTDELQTIKKSDEAITLYILKNGDLELYVSESDAEKSNNSVIVYTSSNEYKNAGTQEGRRAGITQSIEDYYENFVPSENNATKALNKLTDDTILKNNKISTSDNSKSIFLDAYKAGYIDAYNVAQYQLAGYDVGEYRAKSDLIRYDNYTSKPNVTQAYAIASKTIFDSSIKANDTYAKTYEQAYKTGYENAYLGEKTNTQIAYELGYNTGIEAAKRIKSGLQSGQEFEGELKAYISSIEYRTERSKMLSDFSSNDNYTELQTEYDKGFLEGANATSSTNIVDDAQKISDIGLADGENNATPIGAAYAKNDYAKNTKYDYEKAYIDYITSTDVSLKYKLYLTPSEYQNGFILGFETGFKNGYINYYLESKANTVNASKYVQLPSEGDVVAEHTIIAESKNLDVTMTLDSGFGNFFDESFVNVFDTGRSYIHDKSKYTAYSNIYEVDVYSNVGGVKQNFIKLKQPMTISFTHDLGENVGVYKVVGNQLRYMHTEINKELTLDSGNVNVYATIPVGKYYGGTYVLLADEQILKVKDIQNNWNFTGLDTYNRRGWLPVKNGLATPESNITRAQLAYLIERNMNKDNIVSAPRKYNDQSKFYGYDNAINYCVANGYMSVDSKNNFRPTDFVTYADLESILTKALGYKVSFTTYDTKMKNELFHKSNYSVSPKKYITKSETVFTLLSIFQ